MSSRTSESTATRGLSQGHFRRVATHGFGDGANSYPWSSRWFEGRLYIGTNRHGFVTGVSRGNIPVVNLEVYPVRPVPEDKLVDDLDMRGQIWRYDPKADFWECVFRSPLVRNAKGKVVPLAGNFRSMAVFQGRSDPKPVIYVFSNAGFAGISPILFRSVNGDFFEPVSPPGLGFGKRFNNFRGLFPFKGKLFMAPGGTGGKALVVSNVVEVYCTDDPVEGKWVKAFGHENTNDPTNGGVYDLAACGDYLYLSTVNVRNGCQLWKTKADGWPPYEWIQVFDNGAGRGRFNQGLAGFGVLGEDLYMGTFVQNGGYDRHNDIGPIAAEVLRVHPDDTWDIVVGEPRMTPQGLKLPSSGREAGFGNHMNGYVWRLANHEGALYAGTLNLMSYIGYARRPDWPAYMQNYLHPSIFDEDQLNSFYGCEVWRTVDGDRWEPVTRNGFGNHYNLGVRAMVSTPHGLFIGCVNTFGPEAAVKGPGGWRYEPNPRGGLEIWLGDWSHAGALRDEPIDPTTDELPPLSWQDEEDWPLGSPKYKASSLWQKVFGPGGVWGQSEKQVFFRPLHNVEQEGAPAAQAWQHGPTAVLASAQKDLIGPAESALEEVAAYFENGLQNVGYWRNAKITPRQAAEQLLIELLFLLPEPLSHRQGSGVPRAVDPELAMLVICAGNDLGKLGELTARVCPAARNPLLIPRVETDPRSGLPRLDLADASVDVVAWIEESGSREGAPAPALAEVQRVLKPGGHLVLADYVAVPADAPVPAVADPESPTELCTRLLASAGFEEVRVTDITRKTWIPFFRQSRLFFGAKYLFQQLDQDRSEQILDALPGGRLAVRAYVLASAVKPGATQLAVGYANEEK